MKILMKKDCQTNRKKKKKVLCESIKMFRTYYEENTVEERPIAYTATNNYIHKP